MKLEHYFIKKNTNKNRLITMKNKFSGYTTPKIAE